MTDFIQLIDGVKVPFYNIALEVPTIDTIAWSLGMQCRFKGHVKKFYSVAEHSTLVAALVALYTDGDPLEGLLHDAEETIVGDASGPYKPFLPDIVAHGRRTDTLIRRHYGLPPDMSADVHFMDKVAVLIEAHHLVYDGGACFNWPGIEKHRAWIEENRAYEPKLDCWNPAQARRNFLVMWRGENGPARLKKAQR